MDKKRTLKAHLDRRTEIAKKIGDGIAILNNPKETTRSRDTTFPYRFDSNFYYVSGFPEPESVLIIVGEPNPKCILFCREKDLKLETWDGYRFGPQKAAELFQFDEAYSINEIDDKLPQLLTGRDNVFYQLGTERHWDEKITACINRVKGQNRDGLTPPSGIVDIQQIIHEMRLIKDPVELDNMREAAKISARAHTNAMKKTKPDLWEYEIEAEFLYEFRKSGAQAPAYNSIVASGASACTLHYVENNRQLKNGELLLIDAGCEYNGYASDITRTWPVNGKFSQPQKDIYDIVLAAQQAALDKVRVGFNFNDPHAAALRILAQGFLDLKLCTGSVDAVIESGEYQEFYMHRTSHWLGIDVHDVGQYKINGDWRDLEPGMVLTIEPGCYINRGPNIPDALGDIGIRIEDSVLVTDGECEILTSDVVKNVKDIEDVVKS